MGVCCSSHQKKFIGKGCYRHIKALCKRDPKSNVYIVILQNVGQNVGQHDAKTCSCFINVKICRFTKQTCTPLLFHTLLGEPTNSGHYTICIPNDQDRCQYDILFAEHVTTEHYILDFIHSSWLNGRIRWCFCYAE